MEYPPTYPTTRLIDAIAALHAIGLEISTQEYLPSLLTAIIETSLELLEVEEGHGAIYLVNAEQTSLTITAAIGLAESNLNMEIPVSEGLAGAVFLRRESMIVHNYETWEGRSPLFSGKDIHAVVSVPLRSRDHILGTLNLGSTSAGYTFSPDDVQLLELFAVHAAIAISNVRLAQAERRARRQSEALLQASLSVSSSLSLQEVLEKILHELDRVLPYKAAIVATLENGVPQITALEGFDSPESTQAALARIHDESNPIFQRLVRNQEPVIIADVDAEPGWLSQPETDFIRSCMGVPLVAHDQTIGVLMLDSDQVGAYTNDLATIAHAFAASAAVAIQNARLFHDLEQQAENLELLVSERTGELVQQREEMKLILESAGEGIIFVNPGGVLKYANRAFYTITEFMEKDVIGRKVSELFENDPEWIDDHLKTLRSGQSQNYTIHLARPDGSGYDASVTLTPVIKEGKLVHAVGVFRDVTAMMDAARLQNKFVSNVSHELRTPITTLKLFHSLLRSGSPEKQAEYLDTMKWELNRLQRLIEDLLDISRLDHGGLPMHPQPIDLNALIEEVMRSQRIRAEERGRYLHKELSANLPIVNADRDRLIQVLANLLTNAINYTSEGDTIGVCTGVDGLNGDSVVTISVWDTGRGINPQDLPNIFQRFYRANAANVEHVPGTGLGLSIVKEIVELHRGTVTAESNPGTRTVFTVTLPVKP